jgi:hypothetical protein
MDAATVSDQGLSSYMAFNLPQFLRRTPRDSLKRYFAFRLLAVGVDWSAAQRIFQDALCSAVEDLPDLERELVYQDFESADMLADETGQLAIRRLSSFMQAVSDCPQFGGVISRTSLFFLGTPRSCGQPRVWTTAKPGAWPPYWRTKPFFAKHWLLDSQTGSAPAGVGVAF